MEILGYLVFIVIAIVIRVTKAEARKENGEIGERLLNDLKDAFQDRAVPLADISFPPTDEDEEDEFELTVDGRTLKFEVPSVDDDDRGGESHYFSADETGEGHVAHVGLSREKQLEQLETWKEAGLIDEDEYKERKRKIRRG